MSDHKRMDDYQLAAAQGFADGLEACGQKEAATWISFLVREVRGLKKDLTPLPPPPPSHTSPLRAIPQNPNRPMERDP